VYKIDVGAVVSVQDHLDAEAFTSGVNISGSDHRFPSPPSEAEIVRDVVTTATDLLHAIEPADRRLVAVVRDSAAADFTFVLTDEVLRCPDAKTAAAVFRSLIGRGLPESFPIADRALLTLGAQVARFAPSLVMKLVSVRLRQVSSASVLPAQDPALGLRLAATHADGSKTNVNVLGEAIIGEDEARERRDQVIAMLQRADVDAVSVKLSSIAANISPLAFDATVDRVVERIHPIYRAAMNRSKPALVTLDMEEYRDLELTTEVLLRALGNPEFDQLRAGIVLQAYLPDVHAIAERLIEFAKARRDRGGEPLRIRLVKGANLAMERVEAELRGWPLAPFGSKADVDASYKRLLHRLLDSKHHDALVVGLASHNVFDIAYGLVLAEQRRAMSAKVSLEFETLEGMATGLATALAKRGEVSLVYSPVVDHAAFEAAIAYLVRRLDENTSPENFLHAVLDLSAGSPRFAVEADKFASALKASYTLDTTSRREHPLVFAQSIEFVNEPDTDFALGSNRVRARAVVSDWTRRVEPVHPIVGGEGRSSNNVCVLMNPSTGETIGRVQLGDLGMVDKCVAAAQESVNDWAGRSLSERAKLIACIGDVVATRRFEIMATMAAETGKTITQGDPEVSEAIDFARYYASNASEIQALIESGLNTTPHGVVVVTPPWNFPFAILLGGVTGALMAGNAVIIKPAPQAMLCAHMVAECCWAAGVSKDVLQFLPCADDEVGQHLVSHPGVNTVLLTGAIETARMFQAWRPETKVLAETSGKNAMVVTASADIDSALKDLVASAFGHAGQKCSAASLAILAPCWYDDPKVLERLADAVRSLRVGPASELVTDVGPLIEPPSAKLQRALMTLDSGESWLVEPQQLDAAGRVWTPGVRIGVVEGSWFHQTECFGPVLGIMRAKTLDEAIAMQNGVDFGLTAGLQSLDETEIATWVDRVESGNLYVNRSITGAVVRRQPFGGWKASSFGPGAKAGGPSYVLSLQRWSEPSEPDVAVMVNLDVSFADSARSFFFADQDPSGLVAESNVLRHRRLPKGVAVRLGYDAPVWSRRVVEAASRATGTPVWISLAETESEEAFLARLAMNSVDRVRLLGPASGDLRAKLHALEMVVDDAPPTTNPRLELCHWVREQSVTITRHRHGHMINR
jgi:RHH-type transcriptional regulator, proline utilization regulon repressor / proline dehydrogenase / delta 1-pyrroline-5-carboxylate dehydrogenase